MSVPGLVVLNAGSCSGAGHQRVAEAADACGLPVHRLGDGDAAGAVAAAVADGAEVLVAAGGDGTVSLMAGLAVAHDRPLVVVPVGTRNHFAADLGLDRTDPVGVLQASLAGLERRVDVGEAGGHVFVNNVSLGLYARAVRDPDYRRGRLLTLAGYARRAATGTGRRATLGLALPHHIPRDPRVGAVLVSNNAYDFLASGRGRHRARLDSGQLWVYLVGLPKVSGPFPLLRLARDLLTAGQVTLGGWPTRQEVIDGDGPVPVAIDGEARTDLALPLRLRSLPGALRVLVPTPPRPGGSVRLRW